jgi:dolichyl-diphosphooligosaccharide---protein glycosyltransferase
VIDPANRLCDAPGSWFCPGQYPPALQKILASKKDFQQLEDFNKNAGGDDEYTKEYFDNLLGDKKNDGIKMPSQGGAKGKPPKITPEEIDIINEHWENNEITTKLYEIIESNEVDHLKQVLIQNPKIAHIRSEDGRGPMWWAHEKGNKRMVELLKKLKVSETRTDEKGITPLSISKI